MHDAKLLRNDGSRVTLYHGAAREFKDIDLAYGKPFRDFGHGFYATQSCEHAAGIAERNRRIACERAAAGGGPLMPRVSSIASP